MTLEETVTPPSGKEPGAPPRGCEQKRRIRAMFDAVAPRYDLLNHLLSLGIDRRWRRRAVAKLGLERGDRMLDLCAGTGDLGFEALRRTPGIGVVGVDLARNMLARGRVKGGRTGEVPGVAGFQFVQADAECLPLPDRCLDGAGVGFGIRNVDSLEDAFREVARVLRPGSRFVVLEFTTPPQPLVRTLYHAYFHHVLPRVGGWISGRPEAYRYLPDSVRGFPAPAELAESLETCGFRTVTWEYLSGGIAALHLAVR